MDDKEKFQKYQPYIETHDFQDTESMFDHIELWYTPPKLSYRAKVFLGITGLLIVGSIVDRSLFKGRSLINKVENLYSKITELK